MSIDHKCEIKTEDLERIFKGFGGKGNIIPVYLREYHNYTEKAKLECSQKEFEKFVYEVLRE